MKKRSRILHTETRTSHCIAARLSLVNFKHCSGQKITISVACCVIKEDVIVFHFPGRKTRKIRLDSNYFCRHTVFENHRKSLIQHCERSELRLHFEWTKSLLKSTKYDQFWRVFENLKLAVKQCYHTGQISRTKIGVKCRNSNATFWVIFKQCGAEEPPKETEKIASSKSFLTK